jgi:hypothetical protein
MDSSSAVLFVCYFRRSMALTVEQVLPAEQPQMEEFLTQPIEMCGD